VGRTIALNSYLFRYDADLTKAIGNTDLVIRSEYFMPTARTNFFGLGNETVFEKSNGIKYYRARYELANVTVLARNRIKPWIDVRYGPAFQYFQLSRDENEGKYINVADHTGSNGDPLHQSYMYTGGEFQFNVATKNDPMIPTRGAMANATVRSMFPINDDAGNLTQLKTTVSFYSDFLAKDRLVLATRIGLAHNIGDYQYAQANYLGFRENLRGFRLHRFAGRSSAYNNIELRWKITEFQTFLCPITFGLLGFNDVGRVWVDNENSSTWHNGYGGGIWIAPINRVVFTGTLSYSKEDKNMPWITIGFQF
jgi:outer membrane protein assembly factor BamA